LNPRTLFSNDIEEEPENKTVAATNIRLGKTPKEDDT